MVEPRSGGPLGCAAHWRTVCQPKEDGSGDLVAAQLVYGGDTCSGDVVEREDSSIMCINKASFGMISPGESLPPGIESFGLKMCESACGKVMNKMFSSPDCTGQAHYRVPDDDAECQTCSGDSGFGDSGSDSDSGMFVRVQFIPVLRISRVSASTQQCYEGPAICSQWR